MAQPQYSIHNPRWYLIPVRILLVTFLVTLLSFAVSLFLGLLGVMLAAKLRGSHAEMAVAYRDIAFPVAALVATIVIVSSAVMEIRHYRQSKALVRIAEQMHAAR